MRKDVFTRFAAYQDRTGALIPLYMRLLSQGGLIVINKPIFQHLTTTDSLTTGMTEAWFIDMGMADLEMAQAQLGKVNGWSLQEAKARLCQLFYFQACRMAWNKGDHALLWFFLSRSKAVGAIGEELLVKCEYSFMHEFVMGRLARVITDAACDRVSYLPSTLVNGLLSELQSRCPGTSFEALTPGAELAGNTVLLSESNPGDQVNDSSRGTSVFIDDLFDYFRLTAHPAKLVLEGSRMAVRFASHAAFELLSENSGNFQRLCNVYSSET